MTRDAEPGGLWVRVNLLVEPENPPAMYIPPTDLPAVPQVPACVSTLTSGGVRFDSGGSLGPVTAGGSLPATGGEPAIVLVLLLLAGAAMAVGVRRSIRQ